MGIKFNGKVMNGAKFNGKVICGMKYNGKIINLCDAEGSLAEFIYAIGQVWTNEGEIDVNSTFQKIRTSDNSIAAEVHLGKLAGSITIGNNKAYVSIINDNLETEIGEYDLITLQKERSFVLTSTFEPSSMKVYKEKLYVTDSNRNDMYVCDLNTGSITSFEVLELADIWGIRFDSGYIICTGLAAYDNTIRAFIIININDFSRLNSHYYEGTSALSALNGKIYFVDNTDDTFPKERLNEYDMYTGVIGWETLINNDVKNISASKNKIYMVVSTGGLFDKTYWLREYLAETGGYLRAVEIPSFYSIKTIVENFIYFQKEEVIVYELNSFTEVYSFNPASGGIGIGHLSTMEAYDIQGRVETKKKKEVVNNG